MRTLHRDDRRPSDPALDVTAPDARLRLVPDAPSRIEQPPLLGPRALCADFVRAMEADAFSRWQKRLCQARGRSCSCDSCRYNRAARAAVDPSVLDGNANDPAFLGEIERAAKVVQHVEDERRFAVAYRMASERFRR